VLGNHLTLALAIVGMLCAAGLRLVLRIVVKTARFSLLVAAPLLLYALHQH
jgi:hypothetical protein